MSKTEDSQAREGEMRIQAIRSIGRAMIGGLVFSVPLSAIGGAYYSVAALLIPLTVCGCAAVSTIVVWTWRRSSSGESAVALEEKVRELEQRVANMELLDCTTGRLSARMERSREQPPPPARNYEQQ